MKPTAPALLLMIVCIAASFSVLAQTQARSTTVFRCGKHGRELRDAPCPADPNASGSSVLFDQHSAATTHAAREQASAAARQARAMEQDRPHQEAEARWQAGRPRRSPERRPCGSRS